MNVKLVSDCNSSRGSIPYTVGRIQYTEYSIPYIAFVRDIQNTEYRIQCTNIPYTMIVSLTKAYRIPYTEYKGPEGPWGVCRVLYTQNDREGYFRIC